VTPLEFLEAVYSNEELPLPVRLRVAIEAAPYVHPKLSATASVIMGDDFAARLERAIDRSNAARIIDHEPNASPTDTRPPAPPVPDRRFRRA
jgi:hypothetical protein